MKFSEQLNLYLSDLKCTSKKLSEISGISESVISRYRSSERTPSTDSAQLLKLCQSLEELYLEQENNKISKEDILKSFRACIEKDDGFNYEAFSKNLSSIIEFLKINISDMAKYTVFDASHISRIKNGKSRPSEPLEFCKKVSVYIADKFFGSEAEEKLKILLNIKESDGISKAELQKGVYNFLAESAQNEEKPDQIAEFLKNLDNFNLDDYIKAIKFDELKVPQLPFYKTKSGNYFGLDGMKEGELNFFKATVLSKSNEDIFMCSDMPMEDMAEDLEFGKKWMFAIAMSLKKGLHLNIIHNLDRPFNEMMLGLESWIPIYMTGQISPYYLKEVKNSVYCHLNYVSGKCALTGECIKGHHAQGKYYLTSNSAELECFRQKSEFLLKAANPLMEIYDEKSENKFKAFLFDDRKLICDRKRILNSLPLFTLSDELFDKILKENSVSESDAEKLRKCKKEEQAHILSILKASKLIDTVYIKSEEEFESSGGAYLSFENVFSDLKLKYTYENYLEHIRLTESFKNENYKLIKSESKIFDNIVLSVAHGNYAVVSKASHPVIHFIIRHPKLAGAIENFDPLVK